MQTSLYKNLLIICFISKNRKTENFDLFYLKLQQYRSRINRDMGLSQKWKMSCLIVLYFDNISQITYIKPIYIVVRLFQVV